MVSGDAVTQDWLRYYLCTGQEEAAMAMGWVPGQPVPGQSSAGGHAEATKAARAHKPARGAARTGPAPVPSAENNATHDAKEILIGLDEAHAALLGPGAVLPPPPVRAQGSTITSASSTSASDILYSPLTGVPVARAVADDMEPLDSARLPPGSYECAYEASYPGDVHRQIIAWVGDVTGRQLSAEPSDAGLHGLFKTGELLCALVNVLRPGAVGRVSSHNAPFQHRENIAQFLAAASALGVPDNELFDTPDLYEERNMRQVVICVHSLGRVSHRVKGYTGPRLGKPIRHKVGRHSKSRFLVQTNGGLWGKAGGNHHPSAGLTEARKRTPSITGTPMDLKLNKTR